MNLKTAQKQILKNWNKNGTPQMIEFLNDRFKKQLYGQIRDEFDEIVVPWSTGFIFDKNTPKEDMDFLNKLCHTKGIAVFGVTSNIYEEFDGYDTEFLYSLGYIVDAPVNAHVYSLCSYPYQVDYKGNGFWPAGPNQAGYLPAMIFYKAFKYDCKRKV